MPRRLVAAVAAFLLLLAGCSEKTDGNPSPGDSPTEPTTTTEQSAEETTTSGKSPTGDLTDVRPCELLDDTDKASLQLTGGEETTVGQARGCEWRRTGATINDSFTIGVALYANLGIEDIVGTNIQRLPKIGSHEAASYTGTTGFCGMSLAVGEKARADVNVAGGDKQQGCQLVTQLATLVEPRLP